MSMDRTDLNGVSAPAQFTPNSEESFYAVVDSPAFFRQDAQLIYQALREQLRPIPFGDYLKRYIYRQAGLSQPFEAVPIAEYQNIIAESFMERGVPASFSPVSSRVRMVAKNWLTQQTVNRDVVLLLGFGLHMSLKDVDDLLTKGLQEPRLNRKDLREAVCSYCYTHGLGYHKYNDLMQACLQLRPVSSEKPDARLQSALPEELPSESDLLRYAQALMRTGLQPDEETRRTFLALYRQAQEVTAAVLSAQGRNTAPPQNGKPEAITPADIEQVMQASIPKDHHGNLLPMKKSTLARQFRNRRLTRQRMEALLTVDTAVTRYDLLMLHFYIYTHQKEPSSFSKLQYYRRFLETSNRILEKCGMGPVYVANPFECFLLMCMLSEDPMGTYADVMEQSYREAME